MAPTFQVTLSYLKKKKNLTGHPLPSTDKWAVRSEGVQQHRSSFDSVSGYLQAQVWSQCLM